VKEEIFKLAQYLSQFSSVEFPGDSVASILYDLQAGITADEIIEDLDLKLDDAGDYE
jgi:hypothetical protein